MFVLKFKALLILIVLYIILNYKKYNGLYFVRKNSHISQES